MLTLAAFRYRNVMTESGGPIARLVVCDTTILGVRQFQANAFLRPDLIAWQNAGQVFSDAAGTGTADSPMVARYKAISEAIERWAHMAVVTSSECERFGFGVDPSSNGMAAFPGAWKRQARAPACLEAYERFCVLHWWEGYLDAKEVTTQWPGVHAVVIASAAPMVTVILYRRSGYGHIAYGHAAGVDFDSACQRAALELERHDFVVRQYLMVHAGGSGEGFSTKAGSVEQRSIFFAQEEGHELFLERLRTKPWLSQAEPRLIFDGPVPGAWTEYADVWRVVYEPPSRRFLSKDTRYFFW